MGGATFHIPSGEENKEDAIITVKDGTKKIRRPVKLKDMDLEK